MIGDLDPTSQFAARRKARQSLDAALSARDVKNWETACVEYRAYLARFPQNWAIWVQLGHALKESGRHVEALEAYSEALALKADDSDILLSLGHLHKLMGMTEEAINFYSRSAALDNNQHAIDELAAFGQGIRGSTKHTLRPDPITEVRRRRLVEIPFRAVLSSRAARFRVLGDRARDAGEYAAAAVHYRAHLQGHADDFAIWVQLGHMLKETGFPNEALEAYETAAHLVENDADLNLHLGHLNKVLGRNEEAASYYRQAAALGDMRAQQELKSLPPRVAFLIVTPLYKAPELIPDLFSSLIAIADEIRRLGGAVVLINDSPDHAGLQQALDEHLPRLCAHVAVELLANEQNLGFVRSANRGMQMALEAAIDVLLLNSDALLMPGSLTEIVEVARSDVMISAVSPRSNNATICNSPYPDQFRSLAVNDALAAHNRISNLLPKVTYVPTAVGFCLYIKSKMIAEFGFFDTVYGGGYNEENDFLMRCNRCGYRAVLANHAFAYHLGSISFGQSGTATSERERINHAILIDRYPEYDRSVQRYFAGIEYKTQRLLSGIAADSRRRIVFDCRNVGPFHAGTFEYAKCVIRAFVRHYADKFECFICGNNDALVFHEFDRIAGLNFCLDQESLMAPFAAAVRLSQPFSRADIVNLRMLAPVNGFVMLDTIAMDCQYLDDRDHASLWREMLGAVDILGYLSDFSRDVFIRRFNVPWKVEQFVALCSTEYRDYLPSIVPEASARQHLLVMGNHYAHKHVLDTLVSLRKRGVTTPIVALGLEAHPELGVTGYKSGELSQELVDSLYDHAYAMVFPSHYEGFGFPVMHALARGVPVLARSMPILEEIRRKTARGANLHLFETTDDIARAAVSPPDRIDEESHIEPIQTWTTCAMQIGEAIERATARIDYAELARRIEHAERLR